MAYVKNTWVDQKVERPKTYNYTNNDDGSMTLIDSFGDVEELGTPVNADNMNHIEDGLANVGMWQYNASFTYVKGDAVIAIEDDKFVLYKSLKDQNKGNALTNEDYWEKSELGGGGGGLEICDIGMALYVDESQGLRRYLDGQIVDINTNTQTFSDKLLRIKATNPDWFTTEDNWQAEKSLNVDGCVDKFVLNYADDGETVTSVRLPKYPDYIQMIDSNSGLPVFGDGNALAFYTGGAGLNYLSTSNSYNNSKPLYLSNDTTGTTATLDSISLTQNTAHGGANKAYGIATKDNVTAQGASSAGLVADATNMSKKLKLRYFIQIATGVEEAERPINNYQVNNVYSYGMSQYYKGTMNNNSWLRSAGQWNSGTVYNGVYDWIVEQVNSGQKKSNVQIVGSLTDDDGVLSGFNSSSWAIAIDTFNPNTSNWKINVKFTTGAIGSIQHIINSTIAYQPIDLVLDANGNLYTEYYSNNTSTRIARLTSTTILTPNTTYYASIEYDSTSGYTLKLGTSKDELTAEATSATVTPITSGYNIAFGADFGINGAYENYAFAGSIDLNECYISIDNNTIWNGRSVDGFKLSTEEYTDYDWVVNTEEQTFRLPIKNGQECFPDYTQLSVVDSGNFTPTEDGYLLGYQSSYSDNSQFTLIHNSQTLFTNTTGSYPGRHNNFEIYLKAGETYTVTHTEHYTIKFAPAVSYGNLYYYIGDTLQNADLINIARLGEELVDIKITPHIVETYVSGTSGYRIWSKDSTGYRYCEQWGRLTYRSTEADIVVSLLQKMKDTNYSCQITVYGGTSGYTSAISGHFFTAWSLTESSFTTHVYINQSVQTMWKVSGYISD